ncbi:MAG: methyltransferase domain-containing protein, partial [Candidatus Omnitrophica bacterium]|nr:methyltransferase domain-containing protein [Candidatus Omnitrophota bacterium]
ASRRTFLEEIHRKNRYIKIMKCPYCGSEDFRKISEVDKRGIPSDIAVCYSCGGCFKSTMLTPDGAKYYYGKISHTLTGKKVSEIDLKTRMDERVRLFAYPRFRFISHFAKFESGRDLIFEFGCNDGANLVPWKAKGFSVLGIDLDSRLVDFGKKNGGLELIYGDALEYENTGKKPKLVILSCVLDHVTYLDTLLDKVKQIIDPNGYIFIEVPGIRFYGLLDPLEYFDGECNFYFDAEAMRKVLKRHGLGVVYCDEYIRALCTPGENGTHIARGPALSRSAGMSFLLKHIIKIIQPDDIKLCDLLERAEKNSLRARITRKLLSLYFIYHYRSLTKARGVHNGKT